MQFKFDWNVFISQFSRLPLQVKWSGVFYCLALVVSILTGQSLGGTLVSFIFGTLAAVFVVRSANQWATLVILVLVVLMSATTFFGHTLWLMMVAALVWIPQNQSDPENKLIEGFFEFRRQIIEMLTEKFTEYYPIVLAFLKRHAQDDIKD